MTDQIVALIPAYNEARHVAEVVAGAGAHLPVWVVDDGSTDDTAARAEAAGALVLPLKVNQGKGGALRAGFRRALERGVTAVVTLDADGQHDPTEIPTFLEAHTLRGADLIVGERAFRQIPWLRRTTNTIGRWLFSWALGQSVPDNQSGYRLISQRLMGAMLDSVEQRFQFEVEMIVTCVLYGFVLEWVPIRTIYADETSHIRPLHHLYHYFRMMWQTRRRVRRARKLIEES